MAEEFTLYFFPSSYYSLKAYLALQEKGVSFKERVVNMTTNEHFQPWFLKINPKGEVPVLQHGDKFIPDSEAIIDYIDEHYTQGPQLVPDIDTKAGQEAHALRQTLHNVPTDKITFGIICNRNLCTSQPKFPKLVMWLTKTDRTVKGLRDRIEVLRSTLDTLPPENKAEAEMKIKTSEERLALALNEEAVSKLLGDLENVFDEMEARLEKSKKEYTDSDNVWLGGSSISVLDIIAVSLMYRLYLVGIDERYFSDTKRLIVKDYFDRLRARPTVKNMIAMAESTWKYMAKALLWKVSKVGLMIGAVGLGLYGAREVYKKFNSDKV